MERNHGLVNPEEKYKTAVWRLFLDALPIKKVL